MSDEINKPISQIINQLCSQLKTPLYRSTHSIIKTNIEEHEKPTEIAEVNYVLILILSYSDSDLVAELV